MTTPFEPIQSMEIHQQLGIDIMIVPMRMLRANTFKEIALLKLTYPCMYAPSMLWIFADWPWEVLAWSCQLRDPGT